MWTLYSWTLKTLTLSGSILPISISHQLFYSTGLSDGLSANQQIGNLLTTSKRQLELHLCKTVHHPPAITRSDTAYPLTDGLKSNRVTMCNPVIVGQTNRRRDLKSERFSIQRKPECAASERGEDQGTEPAGGLSATRHPPGQHLHQASIECMKA